MFGTDKIVHKGHLRTRHSFLLFAVLHPGSCTQAWLPLPWWQANRASAPCRALRTGVNDAACSTDSSSCAGTPTYARTLMTAWAPTSL